MNLGVKKNFCQTGKRVLELCCANKYASFVKSRRRINRIISPFPQPANQTPRSKIKPAAAAAVPSTILRQTRGSQLLISVFERSNFLAAICPTAQLQHEVETNAQKFARRVESCREKITPPK